MRQHVVQKTPLLRGLFFSGNWRDPVLVVAVLFACLVPFIPGLSGPFMLDDTANLQRVLVGDVSFGSLYNATFGNHSGPTGRPISNLTFIANQLVGGYGPFGYKLVNLALHLCCGLLVFVLARRLLPLLRPDADPATNHWMALGTAALWTIHPLQVSTVLYVVQRMTQLASIFMVLAVLVALARLRDPNGLASRWQGARHAATVGLVAFVGVLCKENGALVPFLLLAIGLALPAKAWDAVTDTSGKRTFWALAVVLPIAVAVVLCVAYWDWLVAGFAFRDFTVFERLVSQPPVLLGYLKSFFFPDLREMGLFLDDARILRTTDPLAWVGVATVALVLTGAWLVRRRMPVLAFAVFWFAANHLLESTFTSLELAFEHRNYLALFGPCLLLATGIAKLGELARPRVAALVAILVLITIGSLTLQRAHAWGDLTTFHLTAARHHPGSMRAQTSAAALESWMGNNSAAIARIHAFRAAHPEAFFPLAMDVEFACEIPGYQADLDEVTRRIRASPLEVDVMSIYQAVGPKVLAGQCVDGYRTRFEAHVGDVAAVYRDAGIDYFVQFFLTLQASLQEEPEAARALFLEAIELNPVSRDTLTEFAYFELNQGNPDAAAVPISKLRTLTPSWHPDSYDVSELERFLAQEMQGASGSAH